jgi:secondary thiamine-phosphate synthase enzyme
VLTLTIQTARKTQLVDVTSEVRDLVNGSPGSLLTLFVPHTTAGVVIQASGEGAKAVASDLESAMERIVDEQWDWQHIDEGDQNPWSHVRAALTASSVSIPLDMGNPVLGPLQTIFFCEFDGPRLRTLRLAIV